MDLLFASVGIVTVMLFVIIVVSGIAGYILSAIGLMRMAENRGIENAWLAWIPVGNLWVMGQLIGRLSLGEKSYEHAEHLLVGALLATVVFGKIPVIGALIRVLSSLLMIYAMFRLYKLYAAERAVLYTVLSIIFPVLIPGILLFSLRFKTQCDSAQIEA
jgi:hypothetical protein